MIIECDMSVFVAICSNSQTPKFRGIESTYGDVRELCKPSTRQIWSIEVCSRSVRLYASCNSLPSSPDITDTISKNPSYHEGDDRMQYQDIKRDRFPIDSLSEHEYYAQIFGNRNGKSTQLNNLSSPRRDLSIQQPAANAGARSCSVVQTASSVGSLVVPLLLAVLVELLVEVLK